MDMYDYDYDYWIRLKYVGDDAAQVYISAVDLPPYITSYADYSIVYFVVIIDETALLKDYPRCQFKASMTATPGSVIKFNSIPDPTNTNSNIIFGLTDYYFYNYI